MPARASDSSARGSTSPPLSPGFSVGTLRLYLPPAIVDRYVVGWRKAGWDG